MYRDIINYIESYKKVAIVGFGIEGKSTYNFIRRYSKMPLTIIDKKEIELKDNNVYIVSGDNYLDDLEEYDLIIKSPGISFLNIKKDNLKITSQLELVLKYFKGLSIGITGTKGKSTTTSLIYEIIKRQNKNTYLAGNIGIPLLDKVEEYQDDSCLVIEMSSHMLEFIDVSPKVGVILNLYQDHLDHDGTVEHYHQNKLNIFKYQDQDMIGIYNLDNDYLKKYMKEKKYPGKIYSISDSKMGDIYKEGSKYYYKDIEIYDTNRKRKLLGDYNVKNIVFALTVIYLSGYDLEKAYEVVDNFEQIDYRLSKVGIYNGSTYYTDTLSTIPMGTISGIEALEKVSTLIFGGMDRGIDYQMFIEYLNKSQIKHFICMPTTGYKVGKCLKDKDVYFCETLEEAVVKALEVTDKNSICLLSPAAPSYEYFKNYKEKADKYKEYLEKYGIK